MVLSNWMISHAVSTQTGAGRKLSLRGSRTLKYSGWLADLALILGGMGTCWLTMQVPHMITVYITEKVTEKRSQVYHLKG